MSAAHTKGPLTADDGCLFDDTGRCAAAVPELIEALLGCRDMLREAAKHFRSLGELRGHAPMADMHADAADAALRRARQRAEVGR